MGFLCWSLGRPRAKAYLVGPVYREPCSQVLAALDDSNKVVLGLGIGQAVPVCMGLSGCVVVLKLRVLSEPEILGQRARKVDFESLDVFGVEDVMDVGGGERKPQLRPKAVFERRFCLAVWLETEHS